MQMFLWLSGGKWLRILFLVIISLALQSLVVRHDVPDSKFILLASQYPQLCHLPMGEATLIEGNWLITAGHIGVDLIRDYKNGHALEAICNGFEYKIEDVIVHPGFRSIEDGLNNDIALIKLERTVTGVVPVKIYEWPDEVGMQIVIAGMGDHGTGLTGPQRWDKITRAATNVIDDVSTQWIHFYFDSPESGKATLLEGISGPGDSGGPAFIEANGFRYIVGISSHQTGRESFGKGRYGVIENYTRISNYSSWISEITSTR
jgi:hypothetical protein